MFKHALVLAVAVAVSLGAAQELMKLSAARAAPEPVAATAAAEPDASVAETPVASADAAPAANPSSPAQVQKGAGGHYWAEADVDGRWIHCLIDTGATIVALTPQDAQRLGIDTTALTYDVPLSTANGQGKAARVQLGYVAVAGARVEKVDAVVVPQGLTYSLLGMSYLGRLSRFEATPDSLILRP